MTRFFGLHPHLPLFFGHQGWLLLGITATVIITVAIVIVIVIASSLTGIEIAFIRAWKSSIL